MAGKDTEEVVVDVREGATETAWHAFATAHDVLAELKSSEDGLTSSEAEARLATYGKNALTPPKKPGFFVRLWRQINNVLIFVLLIAAVVTGALKAFADMGLILGVVFINVAIGMFQEGKAEAAAEAIKAMLSSSATVLRDGERKSVDAELVVPGDVLLIKSGDRIPADIRIISRSNLQVMEAMLTGESVAVSKNTEAVAVASALGDRKCMCYSATTVSSGQGMGVVVATGDNAEIGKISKMVNQVENVKTNLLIQLEILGRWIAIVVLIIALTSFLLAKFRVNESWVDAFSSAVAIAVAIIPEGLPALVTIVLAIGTTVMAHNNAIIRQLPCVETLGSLNVICSDKTGTLTKNEMTAVAVRTAASLFRVTGVGYAPEGDITTEAGVKVEGVQLEKLQSLVHGMLLCNDSALNRGANSLGKEDWLPNGAPTEVALITLGCKAGLDPKELKNTKPRVLSVPFESEHKFMATVHQEVPGPAGRVMYVKGAPERLLPLCVDQVEGDDFAVTRRGLDKGFWQQQQAELSSKGLRVLALCRAELAAEEILKEGTQAKDILARPPFLSLVALVAILDPPRDEAIAAVKIAHKAGIEVKMITGDHALTALAIGKMLGITGSGQVYTGPELDTMNDEELAKIVLGCNVYARASPENKLRIVRALQSRRQVCAMTGDGVNDAPALKAADIGVAMGITGTDVSKEAAKMVLADDNFASIVAAVREGRRVWDNLRKILIFNLPVNFAQGTCIMWSYVIGFAHAPMTAKQVLYVNLITAVTLGMMLAAEPAEATVMDRQPRRAGKRLLGKIILWRIFFVCTLMVIIIEAFYYWGQVLGEKLCMLRSEAFNVLVFMEISYAWTCRYIKEPSYHKRSLTENPWCYASIVITVGLQVFLTYTPGVNKFFGMCGMGGWAWLRTIVAMIVVYIIVEIEKALVDPLLMPMVRPVLRWVENHTPKFLRNKDLEEKKEKVRAKDHPSESHLYTSPKESQS